MRLILPLLLLSGPALAQSAVSLPQGCEALVTIQKRGCVVTHLFTCEADPEGWQRRADYDEAGMTYMSAIDFETQWVESFSPADGSFERLQPGAADPASFSALIGEGVDSFDFATLTEPSGFVSVFRGQDRLTGETVVVDGVTLERTEFEVVAYDSGGAEMWRTVGNEFIHRDWRTFISGTRTVTTPDETWEADNSPVEFIFPGERGFLSSTPHHDCGVVISAVPGLIPADPAG